MSLERVGPVDVIMTPFKVLFGAVDGVFRAPGAERAVEAGLKGVGARTSNLLMAETARGVSTFGAVNANYAATQGMGIKGGLSHMSRTLSTLGPRGMIVAAGVAVVGGLAVALGAKLASHGAHLIGQGQRFGHIADGVDSTAFHGARVLSGLGLIGGGILCLVPGGATLGVPLIAASGTTSAGLGIARWSQQPDNFINCPGRLLDNPLTMPIGMVGKAFNDVNV